MAFGKDYSYMFLWNEQQYYTNHFTWRKVKGLMNRITILSRIISRNTDRTHYEEISNLIVNTSTVLNRTITNGLWTGDIKHMDIKDKLERSAA